MPEIIGQRYKNNLQNLTPLPTQEPTVTRCIGWEAVRKIMPRSTCAEYPENALENCPIINRTCAIRHVTSTQVRLNILPLLVG